jgi:hypothetical protein
MTNYEYLKNLESQDLLKPLFKRGMVEPHIYNYFTLYECYLFELKHTRSKMDAIENVCIACKTYEKKIYRAIKLMSEAA